MYRLRHCGVKDGNAAYPQSATVTRMDELSHVTWRAVLQLDQISFIRATNIEFPTRANCEMYRHRCE